MEVIKIEKTKLKNKCEESQKIRVAAYVRVSTEHENQIHSLKSQETYYREKIKNNTGWDLVNIYSDEGISGTSIYNRKGFVQMINDCLRGKIDLVLTKSISRFARNTVDLLEYIRKLNELGIAVIFEEENINTLDKKGELLLTVLASCAQKESENLSMHVIKGNEMKFNKGEKILGMQIYGYYYDRKNQIMIINSDEAKVVKYIFDKYLNGIGITEICRNLERDQIKSPSGKNTWHRTTVKSILRNYKYTGNYIYGKTKSNNLKKNKMKNNKENVIIIKNAHEKIISIEDFEKVQNLLDKKSKEYIPPKLIADIFEGKIRCGYCGNIFYKCCSNYYCCKNKYADKTCITSKPLKIEFLENAFVKCIKELQENIDKYDFVELDFLKFVLHNYKVTNNFDANLFKRIVKYVLIGNYASSQYSMRFVFKDVDDEIFKDYRLSRKSITYSHNYKEIFSKFINMNIRYLDENRNFKDISKIKISAKVISWEV